MKIIIFTLFILLSISFAMGQKNADENAKALNQISVYSDVYFKFTVSGRAEIDQLPKFISVDNIVGNTVYAYVYKTNYKKLKELNIPFEVVSKTSGTKALTMATTVAQMASWDRYPTYSVYVQMMQNFATTYPTLCKLDTIGTSQNGRLLLVLKITDNPNVDENEPEVFMTGTMHGDEVTGGVLLLRLANYLLTNYTTSQRVKDIVDNEEVWINPFSNPDGTYAGGDNTIANATRYLANGVDPNRNFPNPVQGAHPDGETSYSLETVEMMNFGAAHNFTMSINTHGGAEVFNFPWDSWTSSQKTHADDTWWQYVGHEYADTVFLYAPSGYFTGVSSNGITEGADWYYAYGSRQDYYTYYLLGREVTVELSNTKLLDAAQLPNHWDYNYRSFLNYLRQARYGIHGVITDACTGQPIRAKVFINSHDHDSSHVYSSLPVGDYHRPIYTGTYSVTYSAPGYQSQTISVSATNKVTTTQNVALSPITPIANFSADVTSGCNATINFTDQSITPAGSTYLWNFGDGQTSTLQNPSHTYTASGTYTVSLTVTSCAGNNTKTQTNYITITLPTAPTTTNDNLCGSGTAHLTASGTGTLYWFDAATGGTQLTTGTSYQPNVSSTTTYYVENHVTGASVYGGDIRSNSSGGYLSSATKHYLIFNCTSAATLVSVEVNAQSSGSKTIELQNSSGTVLQTTTVTVPSGISRVTLNFNLPVANGLRLVGPALAALYRNNTGSSYPYNIGSNISITGNSASDLNYYYYFYNWEVKGPDCISARVPSTVTVTAAPTANAGEDMNTCDSSVNLNAIPSVGSGTWTQVSGPGTINFTDTSSATSAVSATSQGSYVLQWTENNSGCTSSDQVNVVFYSQPSANAGQDAQIASGTSAQLNATATGGSGNYSYHWEPASMVSNANIANPQTSSLTSNQTFSLTVTDNTTGCTSSDDVIITVSTSVLTVNINPSSTSVCSGQQVQLNTQVSGGTGSYTYSWASNPAGFTSTESSPTVNPTFNTTYLLTVTDGVIQGTSSVNITVLPVAQASFAYAANLLSVNFTNSSTNASTYYWTFGDGTFSTMSNPSHVYIADGEYVVTLVATNSCGSDTVQQIIHVEASGIDANEWSNINIYPNPAYEVIYVEFENELASNIVVYSIDGKEIFSKTFMDKVCSLDISSLEKGAYLLRISTNHGTIKKMMIKK